MFTSSLFKRAAVVAASAGLAFVALGGTASASSTAGDISMYDSGIGVKCVQMALNDSNVHAGLKVDGIFGQHTKDAVMQFQRTNTAKAGWSLDVDGIVGHNTGSAMMEIIVHNEHDWGNTCWENMPT
ncbi:peptidoglycan-binding domain-containing protein [Kitasatospora sp. NPDC096128]|uniref:peptidoglycan-binding domain-containing protein n=1 Tax=Kitasatospora sp. NPDC096128 TaxID=3155547 RepID=UPI003330E9AC